MFSERHTTYPVVADGRPVGLLPSMCRERAAERVGHTTRARLPARARRGTGSPRRRGGRRRARRAEYLAWRPPSSSRTAISPASSRPAISRGHSRRGRAAAPPDASPRARNTGRGAAPLRSARAYAHTREPDSPRRDDDAGAGSVGGQRVTVIPYPARAHAREASWSGTHPSRSLWSRGPWDAEQVPAGEHFAWHRVLGRDRPGVPAVGAFHDRVVALSDSCVDRRWLCRVNREGGDREPGDRVAPGAAIVCRFEDAAIQKPVGLSSAAMNTALRCSLSQTRSAERQGSTRSRQHESGAVIAAGHRMPPTSHTAVANASELPEGGCGPMPPSIVRCEYGPANFAA